MSNSKNATKRRAWTPERRAKQAENCRRGKPWKYNTGPKTREGKATSAQNAVTHGFYGEDMAQLRRLLRAQRDFVKGIKGVDEC